MIAALRIPPCHVGAGTRANPDTPYRRHARHLGRRGAAWRNPVTKDGGAAGASQTAQGGRRETVPHRRNTPVQLITVIITQDHREHVLRADDTGLFDCDQGQP
jgi:hypothetical protein